MSNDKRGKSKKIDPRKLDRNNNKPNIKPATLLLKAIFTLIDCYFLIKRLKIFVKKYMH